MNKLFNLLGAVFIAGTCLAPVYAEDKKYTLADLQALEKRKAWDELIEHLQDVSPAERSGAWNRVVESACTRPDEMDSTYADSCYQSLKSVLADEPQNTAFAWKAGKWSRQKMKSSEAVPFFAKAGLKAGDPRCKEEDVRLAVVSALGLPGDSYPDKVQPAQDLAFQKCWPETQAAVLKGLTPNSYYAENACPGLKKKGAVSTADAPKCAGVK